MSSKKTIKLYSEHFDTEIRKNKFFNGFNIVKSISEGLTVIPNKDPKQTITSPIEGKIKFISKNKNFFIINTKDNKKYHLYIKLNTLEKSDKAFKLFVKKGKKIKKSQKILEVDFSRLDPLNRVSDIFFYEQKDKENEFLESKIVKSRDIKNLEKIFNII
ncbi:MAG: hypothetical protein HPAVJP_5880 [Candidatus Hepatoplasma vulgare]|nr:MAG: hypothetical protein HPAVJP_5880 [Candidatus Hepatoplasma sp.]